MCMLQLMGHMMQQFVTIATLLVTLMTLASGSVVSDSEAKACDVHMKEISSVRQSLVTEHDHVALSVQRAGVLLVGATR